MLEGSIDADPEDAEVLELISELLEGSIDADPEDAEFLELISELLEARSMRIRRTPGSSNSSRAQGARRIGSASSTTPSRPGSTTSTRTCPSTSRSTTHWARLELIGILRRETGRSGEFTKDESVAVVRPEQALERMDNHWDHIHACSKGEEQAGLAPPQTADDDGGEGGLRSRLEGAEGVVAGVAASTRDAVGQSPGWRRAPATLWCGRRRQGAPALRRGW